HHLYWDEHPSSPKGKNFHLGQVRYVIPRTEVTLFGTPSRGRNVFDVDGLEHQDENFFPSDLMDVHPSRDDV
ncbi:hypothetical protein ACW7EJ_20520, partial [Acinetobacter soli]